MATSDVEIVIDAVTKPAEKSISNFAKSASEAVSKISDSFSLVNTAILAVGAAITSRAIINGFKDVTAAAVKQEDAIKKLNVAMSLAGEYSIESSNDMQTFAKQMQATTTVSDETTLEMLALAKSFGITNEQAKDLVVAATNLSAATGQSLDGAVRQLGKTFSGTSGELGDMIPALKNLTEGQFKAGEAVFIVGERFKSASQEITKTFGGAVTQTGNVIESFKEAIGSLITQNPAFIKALEIIQKAFREIIEFVNENKKTIINLVNEGFLFFIKQVPYIIGSFEFIVKAIEGVALSIPVAKVAFLDLVSAILKSEIFTTVFDVVTKSVNKMISAFAGALKVIIDLALYIPGFSALLEDMGIDVDNVSIALEEMSTSFNESISDDDVKGLQDQIQKVRDNALESGTQTETFFGKVRDGLGTVKEVAQQAVDDMQMVIDKAKDQVIISPSVQISAETQKNIQDQLKSAADNTKIEGPFFGPMTKEESDAKEKLEDAIRQNEADKARAEREAFEKAKSETDANILGWAKSIEGAIMKGAEGSRDLLVKGIEVGVTAWLGPVIGQIAGSIANILTMPGDQLKQNITGLIEAAPEFITAIADNIGPLVEALIDSLLLEGGIERIAGAMLRGIAKGSIALVDGILRGFDKSFKAIEQTFTTNSGKVSSMIKDGFDKGIYDFKKGWTDLKNGFGDWAKTLWQKFLDIFQWPEIKMPNWIQSFLDALNPGSDSSPVGKTKNWFDKINVFKNGVDVSKPFGLTEFNSGGSNVTPLESAPTNVEILLAQIATLLQQPFDVKTSIELDGDTLAKILLNLSRRNVRTA
jgi:hypothetical protein